MTAKDNQNDEQPPTTAAAAGNETEIGPSADETELVPPLNVTTPELAWSHEEGAAGADYSWGRAAERASIILIAAAAVAIAIGLLTWLGFHLYDQTKPTAAPDTGRPVMIEPTAALPRITPAPAAAAPSTVTVTPPAPAPATVTVQAAPPPAPALKPAPALPPLAAPMFSLSARMGTKVSSAAIPAARSRQTYAGSFTPRAWPTLSPRSRLSPETATR